MLGDFSRKKQLKLDSIRDKNYREFGKKNEQERKVHYRYREMCRPVVVQYTISKHN